MVSGRHVSDFVGGTTSVRGAESREFPAGSEPTRGCRRASRSVRGPWEPHLSNALFPENIPNSRRRLCDMSELRARAGSSRPRLLQTAHRSHRGPVAGRRG